MKEQRVKKRSGSLFLPQALWHIDIDVKKFDLIMMISARGHKYCYVPHEVPLQRFVFTCEPDLKCVI